jgi:hypothetical protein
MMNWLRRRRVGSARSPARVSVRRNPSSFGALMPAVMNGGDEDFAASVIPAIGIG